MASWPQMCWLCNVKLISESVAKSHFSGKKHNDKFKALTTGSRDDQTMTAGVSHPRGDDVVITEPWCYKSYENIFMAGSMARSLTVSQRSLNECGISSVNRNKKYHKTEGQLARSRSNSHLSENIGRNQGGAEEDVQRPEVSVAHRGRGRGQGRGGQRGRGGKSFNKDNRQLQPARCQKNNEEFDQEDGEQWSQGGAEEDVQRPEVSVAHRGRGRGQGRGGQRGRGGKSFNKDNTQLQPARCKKSDQSSGNEFQEELSKESIRAAVQEYMKKHPNATSQDMNDVIMHVKRILQSEKSKQHPESRCSDGSSQSNKPESIKCDKTEGKPVQQQHPHIKCTSTKKELGKAKPAESAVDENAIFQYVVKKFSGRCTVKDIQCEMEYMFPPDTTILDWLLKSRSFKVFKSRDSSKLDESLVIVEMYSLKRCIYYTETDCCEYKNCPYVHICQDFLAGCCSDVTCPLSHDLEDEHNIAVFKNLKLCDSFTPEEILTLLRCCTLRVCSDWNNNQKCSLLTKYALCPDMHVCTEFLLGKCTENKCKLGHDFSASGQKLLLQLYSLTKIPEGLLKKAILLPIERNDAICGRRPNHQNEEGSIIKEEAHADKTEFYQEELSEVEELPLENQNQIHLYCDDDDRYICEANLNNQCSTNPKVCGRHHYPSTYLWQIKVDGVWQTSTENDSIEEKYCDPSIDSYIYFMDYHGSKRVTKIDFTRLQCRDDDYIKLYPVRRLTTESYVNGSKNDSKKTVWIWYWEDDSQYWNSYSFDSFPYQDVLEAKYLAHEKACIFMIGHNQYLIQFDEMTQTNIITQKKRNIRRRPLKSQNCPYILHFDRMALPKDADWAPMNTELITVPDLNLLSSSSAKYEMVAAKFFETLDRNKYEIVRIVQVQNLVLWDRYQRKKYVMQQCPYLKNDVKEMFLFHGTPSLDVVRCICKDGFDWRVCGKHGTAYGNGSYFAKDASYSNNYSRADHSGKQYMFLSRVLVGLYAKGSANLTRPPQLDISKPDGDRYHSCVNHLNNPTIFVVFHDDQSYPEYLIEYHELDNQTYLSLIRQRYSTTTSTQRQQPQHLTLASAPIQQQQQQKQQHSTPTSTQEQQPQHLTLYSAPIQQQQQQKQQHSTPTSTQQQQQPQHLTLASAPIQQQQQKQQHSTPTSTQQQQPQHLTLASAPIEKQQQQQSTPKSCIVM